MQAENNRQPVAVRVAPPKIEKLRKLAAERGVRLSDVLRKLIDEALAAGDPPPGGGYATT